MHHCLDRPENIVHDIGRLPLDVDLIGSSSLHIQHVSEQVVDEMQRGIDDIDVLLDFFALLVRSDQRKSFCFCTFVVADVIISSLILHNSTRYKGASGNCSCERISYLVSDEVIEFCNSIEEKAEQNGEKSNQNEQLKN